MMNDIATHGPVGNEKRMIARLDMDDYSPQAKVYWWVMTTFGALILAISVFQVAGMERAVLLQVALGILVAALIGIFPVRIPGANTSLAGAEIFIFLLLLLHGPAACALAAAAEAAVGSWRTSRRWPPWPSTAAERSSMSSCARRNGPPDGRTRCSSAG